MVLSTSTEQDEKTFMKNAAVRKPAMIQMKLRLCRKTKAEALAPVFVVLRAVCPTEAALPETVPPRLAAAYCLWMFRLWKRREMGLL